MENSSYATSYRSTAIVVSNVIGCDDRKLENSYYVQELVSIKSQSVQEAAK